MGHKYRVIYADPPWYFHDKVGSSGSNVQERYPTLTNKQLKSMDIKSLAKDDAILFLWTTDATLKDAIELMEAWGFKYKTVAFTWLKLTNYKKPVHVLGPYISKSCEMCLLGTKGAVTKYIKKRPKQFYASIRGEHSKKPEEIRKRIEMMFPKSKKLELFAREKAPGWDVFGNEVESDVEINVD